MYWEKNMINFCAWKEPALRAKAIEALCRCVGVDDENADIVVSPKQIRLEALSVIYKLFHDLFMSLKTKQNQSSNLGARWRTTTNRSRVAAAVVAVVGRCIIARARRSFECTWRRWRCRSRSCFAGIFRFALFIDRSFCSWKMCCLSKANGRLRRLAIDDNQITLVGFRRLLDALVRNFTLTDMSLPVLDGAAMLRAASSPSSSSSSSSSTAPSNAGAASNVTAIDSRFFVILIVCFFH